MVAEEFLRWHLLGNEQPVGSGNLDNVKWLLELENRADGLTKVGSDMVPSLRLLESGAFYPGILRPLAAVASRKGTGTYPLDLHSRRL